ncbi:MAG: hypothetical protein Q7T33_10070 [Dehalococcoidia bacterium]|nr:hypothetical protein [Dehalococcoidia bacterium]
MAGIGVAGGGVPAPGVAGRGVAVATGVAVRPGRGRGVGVATGELPAVGPTESLAGLNGEPDRPTRRTAAAGVRDKDGPAGVAAARVGAGDATRPLAPGVSLTTAAGLGDDAGATLVSWPPPELRATIATAPTTPATRAAATATPAAGKPGGRPAGGRPAGAGCHCHSLSRAPRRPSANCKRTVTPPTEWRAFACSAVHHCLIPYLASGPPQATEYHAGCRTPLSPGRSSSFSLVAGFVLPVAGMRGHREDYVFSKRSTGSTKQMAPPTRTCTGSAG